jgi:hypothetical protein
LGHFIALTFRKSGCCRQLSFAAYNILADCQRISAGSGLHISQRSYFRHMKTIKAKEIEKKFDESEDISN